MKTQVTEHGIIIPKSMLVGVREVEIKQEGSKIIVVPIIGDDPIFRFGKDPIKDPLTDASEDLDSYIYNGT